MATRAAARQLPGARHCCIAAHCELPRAPAARGTPGRAAYVTLLMGAGLYWKGVVGLAKSLQRTGTRFPFVVLVSADVPSSHLSVLLSSGCQLLVSLAAKARPAVVMLLLSQKFCCAACPPRLQGRGDERFAVAHYALNYTKLNIWDLDDQYDRLIYLDADMLVLRNLDHLFQEVPPERLAGVLDCFCEGWSHPQTRRGRNGYCQVAPDTKPWAGDIPAPALYFNAGMLVLQPSRGLFRDLLSNLRTFPPTPLAEQDFLNAYFEKAFFRLVNEYNVLLPYLWHHPEKVKLEEAYIIHYSVTGSKPWAFNPTAEHMNLPEVHHLVSMWQQVYNAVDKSIVKEIVI
eukprot:SM000007S20964  [mRNA]  locus=s7:1251566:1253235:+ [translate_table: standard]